MKAVELELLEKGLAALDDNSVNKKSRTVLKAKITRLKNKKL